MQNSARPFLAALLLLSFGCDKVFEEKDAPPEQKGETTPEQKPLFVEDERPALREEPPALPPPLDTADDENPPDASDINLSHEAALKENNGVTNFAEWLMTADGADQIARVGQYKYAENELALHQDTLLSFSSYSDEKPLRIRTHGKKLILIGRSMRNLFIETQSENSASGEVVVFLAGSDLPTINTEGAPGRSGASASCPESMGPCVEPADRTSRRKNTNAAFTWMSETLESRYNWNDSFLTQGLRDTIKSLIQKTSPTDLQYALCGTGTTYRVGSSEPEIEGTVILKQTLRFPVAALQTNEQISPHARLVEGEAGEDGKSAGGVRIFILSKEKQQAEFLIKGGKPGQGGRHIKIPAAEKTDGMELHSEVVSEQFILSELKATRGITGACGAEVGSRPSPASRIIAEKFSTNVLAAATNSNLHQRSVSILPSPAGDDIDPQVPHAARSGAEGKNAIMRVKSVKRWETWRKLIPAGMALPREVLVQSPSTWSPERLSGETLGLKTLPL